MPTVAPLTATDERLLAAGYPAAAAGPRRHAAAVGLRGGDRPSCVREHFADAPPTLFFEPGRAVSSSAQVLLLHVLAVKPGPAARGT